MAALIAMPARQQPGRRTIRSICEKLQTGTIVISTFNWGAPQDRVWIEVEDRVQAHPWTIPMHHLGRKN